MPYAWRLPPTTTTAYRQSRRNQRSKRSKGARPSRNSRQPPSMTVQRSCSRSMAEPQPQSQKQRTMLGQSPMGEARLSRDKQANKWAREQASCRRQQPTSKADSSLRRYTGAHRIRRRGRCRLRSPRGQHRPNRLVPTSPQTPSLLLRNMHMSVKGHAGTTD